MGFRKGGLCQIPGRVPPAPGRVEVGAALRQGRDEGAVGVLGGIHFALRNSKGYRQRDGLAAAILHHPEVLILEEPTEGLDPNQRVEIRRLVSSLGRERTVLLSTHVMQEVEATCSRVVILSRGALAAIGSVQELLANHGGTARYVVEAQGTGITETLSGLSGVSGHTVEEVEGRIRVVLEAMTEEDLRPKIFSVARDNSWVLWELYRERASLEQVFRDLTSEGLYEEDAQVVVSQEASAVEGYLVDEDS